MSDKPAGVDVANRALDQAVRDYVTACSEAWGNDNPGIVVGWTLGIGITRITDGEDDALMVEGAPGMNNYLARGIADATAEVFQSQASGWGDVDD